MTSENQGGGGRKPLSPAESAAAFALCRRRLERAVAASCDPSKAWPARVSAAIRAALEFAEAEPVAARVLTVHAAYRRLDGADAFAAMVDRFATRLAEGAPATVRPELTARGVVLRIARQTLLQLELRPGRPATEIVPDLVMFALTPYTGFAAAQRWAADA
ncbi:MAG TPA: hypothetical protein VHA54_11655 [Solirubrobacterales bacterium]|nr:hypothetical protein [Solirubrobacterales bacterium]